MQPEEVTTQLQKDILREMGIDGDHGISCFKLIMPNHSQDPEVMFPFRDFLETCVRSCAAGTAARKNRWRLACRLCISASHLIEALSLALIRTVLRCPYTRPPGDGCRNREPQGEHGV